MINLFVATLHITGPSLDCIFKICFTSKEQIHRFTTIVLNIVSNFHRGEWFWAGLWTDLIIEQIIMRSLKISGDLIRGVTFPNLSASCGMEYIDVLTYTINAMSELTISCWKRSQHIKLIPRFYLVAWLLLLTVKIMLLIIASMNTSLLGWHD